MKSAIIVGSKGQDGNLLIEYLLKKNYKIIGIDKDAIDCWNIEWKKLININKIEDIYFLLTELKPDEIYYLAAFHHSSEDVLIENVELFKKSYEVNLFGLVYFLEALRKHSRKTKLFYASSSMIFANCEKEIQDENTKYNPNTIYGMTKMDGLFACRYYRKKYNIFAAVGILYNHESIYREEKYISKKIIKAVVDIKKGKTKRLVIGDLKSEVDWGYAPDYVEAFYKILKLKVAEDFIIATGIKHTVLDFIENSFNQVGLNWKDFIQIEKSVVKRKRNVLVGNTKKIMEQTGWKPSVNFTEMIRILIEEEEVISKNCYNAL